MPATQKLVSIFEPHTAIIRRGKARNTTEFGRKVWLSAEVDGGIISGFRILQGNAGDEAQLKPALDDHLRLFGKPPQLVAAERNVHSKENERLAKEMGVKKVCLPKAGKKSVEREEHERQRWFKRARKDLVDGQGGESLGPISIPHSPNVGDSVMLEADHKPRSE